MTYYHDERFIRHIHDEPDFIFEIGGRYGEESVKLKTLYPKSSVHTFECNPDTVDICKKTLTNKGINFVPKALGDKEGFTEFYPFGKRNDGASSMLKRIDGDLEPVKVEMTTLKSYMGYNNIQKIDLLCMDVQGYELEVLKGLRENIDKVSFVIMEQPKNVIDPRYLKPGLHSKYIGAPNPAEIIKFMKDNNFKEIERLEENKLEDNVMYSRF